MCIYFCFNGGGLPSATCGGRQKIGLFSELGARNVATLVYRRGEVCYMILLGCMRNIACHCTLVSVTTTYH